MKTAKKILPPKVLTLGKEGEGEGGGRDHDLFCS